MNKYGRSCLGEGKNCDDRYAYTVSSVPREQPKTLYPDVRVENGVLDGDEEYYSERAQQNDGPLYRAGHDDIYRPKEDLRLTDNAPEVVNAYGADPTVTEPPSTVVDHGAAAPANGGENGNQCEQLTIGNFKLVKQQHYTVDRNGREYFYRYVVTYRLPNSTTQHDMFTYTEGLVHAGPIENRFSHLCGEVLSSHSLPAVNSLDRVYYYTAPELDPDAPFHLQEEVCKTNNLTPVPLRVDTSHQVLVFRTYHDTVAIQLMPTVFSDRFIVAGTPLFHGARKNICATVGTSFSEFHYVVNGAPCQYVLFGLGSKDKTDSGDADRSRLIVLDRRDRVDSEEWSAGEAVLNSISDVALPIVQRVEGKHSRLDVRDILYVGVVNNGLQLTDNPAVSKKYKPPKTTIVVVINNRGVYATQVRDKEITSQWVQADAKVTYSILPRHYFDKPRTNIVRTNTVEVNAKLQRAKSKEMLI